jgi:phi LC3 family holin
MKINWKVRFKNKVWLSMFLSLIVGFVYNILAAFDIFPVVTEPVINKIIGEVLTFLGLIGVLVDPTTQGIGDSNRAMQYDQPWVDTDEPIE